MARFPRLHLSPRLLAASALVLLLVAVTSDAARADGDDFIELEGVISVAIDGTIPGGQTQPHPTLDDGTNNGILTTYDWAEYVFEATVNPTDGNAHQVTDLTFVSVLPDGGNWQDVPASCPNASISNRWRELRCTFPGPITTGTTVSFTAKAAFSGVIANNSVVPVNFELTADMVPDADGDVDPFPATSNDAELTILSEETINVRKNWHGDNATAYNIIRDGDGNPTHVDMRWGISVEPDAWLHQTMHGAAGLGDSVSFVDALSDPAISPAGIFDNAVVQDCDINGAASVGTLTQMAFGGADGTVASLVRTSDAGDWACTQANAGDDIQVDITGIDLTGWAFPPGTAGYGGAPHMSWNYSANPYHYNTWNTGNSNSPAFGTGVIEIRVPFADLVAADNTPGDLDLDEGEIRVCNVITDVTAESVDGSSVIDETRDVDNVDCMQINVQSDAGIRHQYVAGVTGLGYHQLRVDMPAGSGSPYSTRETGITFAGQEHFINMEMAVPADSIAGAADLIGCIAIDDSTQTFVPYDHAASGSSFVAGPWGAHTVKGSASAPFVPITNADVVIEFAAAGAFADWTEVATADCGDPGLSWVADPTTLPGGIEAANLVRWRTEVTLPPGMEVRGLVGIKNHDNLALDTRVFSYSSFAASNFDADEDGNPGGWSAVCGGCDPVSTDGSAWHWWSAAETLQFRRDNDFDQHIVRAVVARLEKNDTDFRSNFGWRHSDFTEEIAAGDEWTTNLQVRLWRPGVGDVDITDMELIDTLPPDLEFVSSSPVPDAVINDCDAENNPACITDPIQRTNIGFTTLTWDLGDVVAGPGSTLVPSEPITVTVDTPPLATTGTCYANIAWVNSPDFVTANPTNETTSCTTRNDGGADGVDADAVSIAQPGVFTVGKATSTPYITIDGSMEFSVEYANPSSVARSMDIIDIFPFDADGRIPSSDFDGGVELEAVGDVDLTAAPDVTSVWITDEDPGSIPPDPIDNVATGTGIWLCELADAGTLGCPALADVTALRFLSTSVPSSTAGEISITLLSDGSDRGALFVNRVDARAGGLQLPVRSEDVTVRIPCPAIGNRVFIDLNANGMFDSGEPTVENVSIDVVGTAGVVETVTTDANGSFQSGCLAPGDYYLVVHAAEFAAGGDLAGLAPAPNAELGDVETDEEGDHNVADISGVIRTIAIELSENSEPENEEPEPFYQNPFDADENLTVDLGFVGMFNLGDTVYLDEDNSGAQNGTEPGVPGIVVELLDAAGAPVLDGAGEPITAVTDADGNYLFEDLLTGTYTVRIVPTSLTGGLTVSADPDGGVADGSSSFVFTNTDLDQDFGLTDTLFDLGDTVFEDLDGNGVQDPGEPGIEGVTVELTTPAGTQTAVTGPDGEYAFADLAAGDYTITIDVSTIPFDVTPTADPDVDLDNTSSTTLAGDDDSFDFGYRRMVTLGDQVWLDANGDEIFDAGETGLEGVVIEILDADGNIVASPTTDADGLWSVDLPSAWYEVRLGTGLPAQNWISYEPASDDLAGLRTADTDEIDFGIAPFATIGDFAWVDLDGDGTQDSTEPGLADVRVEIRDLDGTVIASTTTDASGAWTLSVPGGEYHVAFVLPDGYGWTNQNSTTEIADSDADANGLAGCNGADTCTVTSETIDHVDAGFIRYGCVAGIAWEDVDGDGVREGIEERLNGLTVEVRIVGQDELVTSTTTAEDGSYEICDLPPNSYVLRIIGPDGFDISPAGGDSNYVNEAGVQFVLSTQGETVSMNAGYHNAPSRVIPLAFTGAARTQLLVWSAALALLAGILLVAGSGYVQRYGSMRAAVVMARTSKRNYF